jgi:hypothetical protein
MYYISAWKLPPLFLCKIELFGWSYQLLAVLSLRLFLLRLYWRSPSRFASHLVFEELFASFHHRTSSLLGWGLGSEQVMELHYNGWSLFPRMFLSGTSDVHSCNDTYGARSCWHQYWWRVATSQTSGHCNYFKRSRSVHLQSCLLQTKITAKSDHQQSLPSKWLSFLLAWHIHRTNMDLLCSNIRNFVDLDKAIFHQ